MILTIDTEKPLSERDAAIMKVVMDTIGVLTLEQPKMKAEPEPKREAARDDSPQDPEPEIEESTISKDVAIQRAVDLVSTGEEGVARVKAALNKAGTFKRVSELTDDAVPTFLEALDS